jgi:hypothetical protein
MDDLVAERGWHSEHTAVDLRARTRRGDGRSMANGAANFVKQRFSCEHVSRQRPSRGRLGRAHKVSEGHNILTIVLGVSNRIISRTRTDKAAIGGVLIRKQRCGNTHFVEVSVGGK